jgi:hypothetical protein
MEFNEQKIVLNLETHLLGLKIDPTKLFGIMKKYQMILSGSFLLQSIQNTDYEYYDIDLFVLGSQNLELENEMKELLKLKDDMLNITAKEDTVYNKNYSKLKSVGYEDMNITSVSSITNHEYCAYKGLQIIYIDDSKYSNVVDFIDGFDIDVCMNYFDGEKVFIKYPESIKSNIATYTTGANNSLMTPRQRNRIIKYSRRGFNIKINFINLNKIYDTLILLTPDQEQVVNPECINLFVIFKDSYSKFNFTNSLPYLLEELIIVDFYYENKIDNLPITLKILKIYDSQYGLYKKNADVYNKYRNTYSSLKIPFGCNFIVNDRLFS